MKILCVIFIFAFVSELGFCQSRKTDKQDDETIVIEQKTNRKYDLTATFHGINFRYGNDNELSAKIIRSIIFRDNRTGAEVEYKPTGDRPAGDFYFTEIWSPDEEYLILPIGTFQGFGVFEAKNALEKIKYNNYFDTIKVKLDSGGFFAHAFEKWEDDSTFSFRAGLDGDMFAYKYNLEKKELYCYQESCEKQDIGFNNKSKIKAIKKGEIEPTQIR